MKNPVIIFGTNGIAKAAMEIFQSHDIMIYGFLSEKKEQFNTEINNILVLGGTQDAGFTKLIGKKCEAFVADDDNASRKKLVKFLNETRKVQPANAVHSRAYVSGSAAIGHGNFINAGAFVGADTEIKNHCMIHSNAVLEHEVTVEDYVQIGAGAIINPGVKIEEGAFIGSGAIIVSGVTIGKNARVGAGSMVMSNVEKKQTVFGNPAAVVKV